MFSKKAEPPLTTFNEFGLAAPIARALAEENYVAPTPIQAGTIPLAIAGRDIIGIAQTGTGKTAAFALPILHRLAANSAKPVPKTCRVLVLSPTRELSNQIVDSFRAYGRHLKLSVAVAIGGVPIGRQIRSLAGGVDVLVATPGRLLDLIESRALMLDRVAVLVLDEADRMLDMGFIRDIRRIVGKLPAERQTLFFSATMPKEIAGLAEEMLRDPARVAVTPVAKTADRIDQRVIHADRVEKPGLLVELLRQDASGQTLVFTRTKHGADRVVRILDKAGLEADAIHGNKSQGQRERVLAAFRDGRLAVLVATDIAARGIDVAGIGHVVNYDLPNVPESYVHRIGRTARAGASGIATSLVSADEVPFLRDIEKLIRFAIPATGAAPAPARAEQPAGRPARNGGGRPARGKGGRPERGPAQAARADHGGPGEKADSTAKRRRRRRRPAPASVGHGHGGHRPALAASGPVRFGE
jgi:ATP-dependent RNA helicase RhlE